MLFQAVKNNEWRFEMVYKIVCHLLVLAGVVLASAANAGLITFEEFGTQSCFFSQQPPLDTQYSSFGVNFSGGWEIVNQCGNFGAPARSGEHFAAFSGETLSTTDTLTVNFDNAMTAAIGFLGSNEQGIWLVTAFFEGIQVSQLNLTNTFDSYVEFNFEALRFDQIIINASSRSGVLDDLSFEVAQVPEPSSLALLTLMLAGLSFSCSRKI
jgi:hypothetical protein